MRKIVGLLILVLLYGATVATFYTAGIETATLYATKDSYSWQSVPDANNGGSDNFEITSFASHNMRGWIEFNTSRIPSGVWILNAQLRLRLWHKTTNDPPYGDSTGRTYGVYEITQPWGENTVNWANQPSYSEQHYATAQVPVEQGDWFGPVVWMSWDITSIENDWMTGNPNYGLVVRDTQENATLLYSTQFFTHNQVPNIGYYPRLIVTYLYPTTLYALVFVLVAETAVVLFWLKKKQRRNSGAT